MEGKPFSFEWDGTLPEGDQPGVKRYDPGELKSYQLIITPQSDVGEIVFRNDADAGVWEISLVNSFGGTEACMLLTTEELTLLRDSLTKLLDLSEGDG